MKKVIIVKLIILIILIALCVFMYIKFYNTKNSNKALKLEIKTTETDTKLATEEIEVTKTNIEKLKEEKKDSIWELETWKLMKEKIEKAL